MTDEAFTIECMNRFATDNGNAHLSTAPAIACFKQLSSMEITECNKLTADFVNNGIVKCKTLKKLQINDCANLKEEWSQSS